MQEIKIEKAKLLTVLQENKTKHEEAFKEATEAFYAKFIDRLARTLAKVEAKEANHREAMKQIQWERPPEGHCDDYERQIKMLEYDTRDEIDLTPTEFAQYVLDEWNWRDEFAGSYLSNTGKFYR